MRILESKEKNENMKRSYLIQGIELEFIKKLQIPTPESIESVIETMDKNNLEKFYKFTKNEDFDFINNQHWMVSEIEVVYLNLFEIEKMRDYLLDERGKIIEGIRRIGTRDGLEEIKVDLLLNEYRSKCFDYLKKEKEKEEKTNKKRK